MFLCFELLESLINTGLGIETKVFFALFRLFRLFRCYICTMEINRLYEISSLRHRQLGKDVVHDLFLKFGGNEPPDAYVRTCVNNARPEPLQQIFEMQEEIDDIFDEDTYNSVAHILEQIRKEYELEVDTFLACKVEGTIKSFSQESGVSRSVLENICKFVKYEVLRRYNRT